jgi:hypothetical protein
MMSDAVRITNMPGGPARVAFDLMEKIAQAEYFERGNKDPENPRQYYLELYEKCRAKTGY